jgi:RHS repeat-associated protein
MLVPNRHGSSNSYRYGFQGQEKDDELKGEGNSLNYTFRMHDPRVGRFFAVDPLTHKYPNYTPYSFSGNKVINAVEIEGLEEYELINAKDFRIRIYKVQVEDNLSVISKSTGVSVNDILKFNSFIQDPNKIYPNQILFLRGNITGIKLNEFKINKGLDPEGPSWFERFIVELVTSNDNGPSIQSQAEVVMLAEGGVALTSLPRLLKSGFKGVKKLLTPRTTTPKAPVIESAPNISAVDDAVEAGSIRDMNKGAKELGLGGRNNCVNNAIGVDLQLAGSPNSAMPMAPLTNGTYLDIAQPLKIIENFYKGRTFSVLNGGMEGIAKALSKEGDRAIIYGKYANGEGHVLNAVRQNGKINLLDGQVGSGGTISNFTEMKILKTN